MKFKEIMIITKTESVYKFLNFENIENKKNFGFQSKIYCLSNFSVKIDFLINYK